jgi:signal peptidase I
MLEYETVVRILREIVITALIAVAIFVPLKTTVQAYEVQYSCMVPNIEDGDWIIVDKCNLSIPSSSASSVCRTRP